MYCLATLLVLVNLIGVSSSGKGQIANCCIVSGLYLYMYVSYPVTMFQTWWDLPSSNLLSIRWHQSTLPCLCSLLRLWAPNGHNVSVARGSHGEWNVDSLMKSSWNSVSQRIAVLGLPWLETPPWRRFWGYLMSAFCNNGHCFLTMSDKIWNVCIICWLWHWIEIGLKNVFV